MTKVNSTCLVRPLVDFTDGPWNSTLVNATELTSYHRADSSARVQRGRTNEFSKFQAGKLSNLVLENRARTFDPAYNPGPPFAGNIDPSKLIQLLAEYPWLPGQLPDGDLRNTTVGLSAFGAPGTNNVSAVTLDLTQGYIKPNRAAQLQVTSTSTPFVALGSVKVTPGQTTLVSIRAMSSAANRGISFFTKYRTSTGAFLSSTDPETESYNLVNANAWYGPLVNQTGIVAPAGAAFAWVFAKFTTNATVGDLWWLDAIVLDYCSKSQLTPIFQGFVDDWHLEYKGRDATCNVSASDAFASFAVKDIVGTGYEAKVLSLTNLRHYWTMGQPSSWTSSTLPEDGPAGGVAAIKYFAAFGVPGPVLTDLTTGVGLTDDQTLAIGGWFDLSNMATPVPGNGYTVGWWFQMNQYTDRMFMIGDTNDPNSWVTPGNPTSGINGIVVYTGQMTGHPGGFNVVGLYGSTSFSVILTPPPVKHLGPNGLWDGSYIAGNAWDGAWHLFVMSRNSDNQTFSFYIDGQQVTPYVFPSSGTLSGQNLVAPAAMPIPSNVKGLLGGSNDTPGFTGQLAHFWVQDAVIIPSNVALLYNMAQAQWFGQTPGSRLNAVLDAIGFPSAWRNIDAGNSTLNAEVDMLSQQNSLQYMQYVEDSENGWLFVDKSGNVRFISRQNLIKPPGNVAQWILGDLWPQAPATELPINDTKIDNSNTLIYTEAEGSRKSGDTLYVYGTQMTLQGKRTISLSNLLNASDQEVVNILNYRVSMYQNPKLRITQVKINPGDMDELWQFVLQVELGQVVTVKVRPDPAGSTPISTTGRVQQIQHTYNRKEWETVLDLADVDVQTYLQLGDAVLGKLDAGNRLAY